MYTRGINRFARTEVTREVVSKNEVGHSRSRPWWLHGFPISLRSCAIAPLKQSVGDNTRSVRYSFKAELRCSLLLTDSEYFSSRELRSKTAANLYFQDFTRTVGGISPQTNVDWYTPIFEFDLSLPAVEIL